MSQATAKSKALTDFRKALTPLFETHGFSVVRRKFVRSNGSVTQQISSRKHLDLDDRFFIEWNMEVTVLERGQELRSFLQFLLDRELFDSVMMAPYGPADVEAAVRWHTYWLQKRVLVVADRLFDPLLAMEYNDEVRARVEDSVNLLLYRD